MTWGKLVSLVPEQGSKTVTHTIKASMVSWHEPNASLVRENLDVQQNCDRPSRFIQLTMAGEGHFKDRRHPPTLGLSILDGEPRPTKSAR